MQVNEAGKTMDAAARLRVSYILVYNTCRPGIRPHQVVHAPHRDQIHTVLLYCFCLQLLKSKDRGLVILIRERHHGFVLLQD